MEINSDFTVIIPFQFDRLDSLDSVMIMCKDTDEQASELS